MPIHDHERLARFIATEVWINQGQIKGDAFRPKINTTNKRLETSAQWYGGDDLAEIRARGRHWAGQRKNQQYFGWADVSVGDVRIVKVGSALNVEADTSPSNPRHANIIGWHIEKAQQWIQAEEIARKSVHIT